MPLRKDSESMKLRDYRMRLRLAIGYVVGEIYPRRGAAGGLKICKGSFEF
jgi:hypothetical protein